jgi:hypothetical protein
MDAPLDCALPPVPVWPTAVEPATPVVVVVVVVVAPVAPAAPEVFFVVEPFVCDWLCAFGSRGAVVSQPAARARTDATAGTRRIRMAKA